LTFIRVSTDMMAVLLATYALHLAKMLHGTVTEVIQKSVH